MKYSQKSAFASRFFIKTLAFFLIITFLIPSGVVLGADTKDTRSTADIPAYVPGEHSDNRAGNEPPVKDEPVRDDGPTFGVTPDEREGGRDDRREKDRRDERDKVETKELMGGELGNDLLQMSAKEKYVSEHLIQYLPEVDNLTGALTFKHPLVFSKGRAGLEPNLSLSYNSQKKESTSIVGFGWSLDIPYIQRINKKGSERMFSDNFFMSSSVGELVMTATSTSTYKAKVDNGEFISYTFLNNTWIAVDKKGTIYKFGNTSSSQYYWSNQPGEVYQWMLDEIRDVNGNYIRYEYEKPDDELFPYPSNIVYTGNDSSDGIFEIKIIREQRPDKLESMIVGYPTRFEYRISEIRSEINGGWVKKYSLGYATSTNGGTSLLTSITETGRDEDGSILSLPPTEFSYQMLGNEWSNSNNIPFPTPFSKFSNNDYKTLPVRMVDVNGDSLVDVINTGEPGSIVYLNTGSGWATSTLWDFPDNEDFILSGRDQGVRLVDVNGDGLVDILSDMDDDDEDPRYYENNGINGWDGPTTFVPPIPFVDEDGIDNGVRLADVNGDGLVDFVVARISAGHSEIYLNNGEIFESSNLEVHPTVQFSDGDETKRTRILDVNNDSLADLIICEPENEETKIYFHQGDGNWPSNSSTPIPFCSSASGAYSNSKIQNFDLNNDNLPDLQYHSGQPGTPSFVYWGAGGTTWSTSSMEMVSMFEAHNGEDIGVRNEDLNGDGLIDQIRYVKNGNENGIISTMYKVGVHGNIINKIKNPKGGEVTVDYKNSPMYRNDDGSLANPHLPIQLYTTEKISVHDGFATTSENTYFYASGTYYFKDSHNRKFAGFGRVEKTDAQGNVTKSYFHQGNYTATSSGEYDDHISKAGRPYLIEQYDSEGNLFSKTINTWDRFANTTGVGSTSSFVKLAQTIEFTYDGDSDHRDKAESYVYNNASGDMTQKISWGEVNANADGTFTDTGNDKFTTLMSYATSSATSSTAIILPSRELVLDSASTTVRDTKMYYDGLPFGQIQKGNVTKQEMLVDGSTYIDVERSYNTFGLVVQEKDARDHATTYSYDTHNLYASTTLNALLHSQKSQYDYSAGKPKKIIDANGRVFEVVYDGLDRIIEEKQPNVSSPTTLVTKTTYTYNDTSFPTSVIKTDYLNSATSTATYTYFDGLGRVIQERKRAEDANTYVVKDTLYDNRGLKQKESLPYFASGSAWTSATATPSLYNTFGYDALGRITEISNVLGTTTNTYDDWKLTVTDANGNDKDLYKDARGNLVQVNEHNGTSTYTTLYEWNGLNNLTKITDALGNIRNLTYDNLGRRTKAEDLHAPSDTHYSSSTYTYDETGNVIEMIDGKGQVVEYTYDDLNRQLSENFTGQTGVEIIYVYDNCGNGIGRLCFASSTGSIVAPTYDALGRVSNEVEYISSRGFSTSYEYDRQGNQTKIITPGNAETHYIYNSAGLVEKIGYKPSGGALSFIVEDIDYSPEGKISFQDNANGTFTQNTYDAGALYRLTNRYTESDLGGISPVLQDITYSYDPVGNITSIDDQAPTNNGKTVVYTYDDLNRLTLASTTSTNNNQGYREAFTYDALGNILTKGTSNTTYLYQGTTTGSYANPHAVTKIRTNTLTYDHNGNLTTYLGATSTYTYRNELASHVKGATTTTYLYDHEGQRVAYTSGTTTTLYPNKYLNTSPSATTTHIFLGDSMVATIQGTTTHYHHTDHLGSASVSTTDDGSTTEITDYYSYGDIRYSYGDLDEQRKFTGHEYDGETDMTYMGARYYDAHMGRFRSVDPVFSSVGSPELKQKTGLELEQYLSDPQVLNSYSYVRNNPVNATDPDGNFLQYIAAALFWPEVAYSPNVGEEGGSRGLEGALFAGSLLTPGGAGASGAKGVSKVVGGVEQITENTAPKIAAGLRLGETTGALGRVIENATGKITGFNHDGTFHGLNQIITRGVSPEALLNTVKEPLVRFAGRFDRIGYLSQEAYVVLDKAGEVVTAWTKKEFNSTIKGVLQKINSKKNGNP